MSVLKRTHPNSVIVCCERGSKVYDSAIGQYSNDVILQIAYCGVNANKNDLVLIEKVNKGLYDVSEDNSSIKVKDFLLMFCDDGKTDYCVYDQEQVYVFERHQRISILEKFKERIVYRFSFANEPSKMLEIYLK